MQYILTSSNYSVENNEHYCIIVLLCYKLKEAKSGIHFVFQHTSIEILFHEKSEHM